VQTSPVLILRLMMEDRFPGIWVPSWENRDLRQLLWHRHRMVQARTRLMNQLQAVALNEGLRCKKKLWRDAGRAQLESFRLAPWASRRRRDLLELLDRLARTIAELSTGIEQEAERCPEAQRLRTHPGVGSLTALAFVLIVGRAERFQCGKQIASYLGLVPSEESSGDRRRLGHITKQGSSLLRFLLVEAAQVTVRSDPAWGSKYFHLAMRRGRKIAGVKIARVKVLETYKGRKLDELSFVAQPTWTCDISDAVRGETALLLLHSYTNPRTTSEHPLFSPRPSREELEAEGAGKAIFLLMDSGRGRMPLRTIAGQQYATLWVEKRAEVTQSIASGGPSISMP
jgi:hypothetical protein